MSRASAIWRDPDEESADLYPGLVVHDGRVSGSITFGKSRLPLWTTPHYLAGGWDEFCGSYGQDTEPEGSVYGFTEDRMGQFLTCLFEMRGEFGRLLLVLADAERVEQERSDAHFNVHAPGEPVVRMDLGDGEGIPWPDSWWEMPDVRAKVHDQLMRCLKAIEAAS